MLSHKAPHVPGALLPLRVLLSLLVLLASCPALTTAGGRYGAGGGRAQERCERVAIPLCLDMRYNETRMPNLVGHATQAEAALQIQEFTPLVQFGCSKLLKFFLCSMYAPMCTVQVDETMVIPACRSMCQQVRARCEPVLLRFNFGWPAVLDCAALPERSDRSNLCIDPPDLDHDPPSPLRPGPPQADRGPASALPRARNTDLSQLLDEIQGRPPAVEGVPSPPSEGGTVSSGRVHCPDRYVQTDRPPASPSLSNFSCAPRCGVDVLFSAEDKRFMEVWMVVWAALSFTSALVTTATCLIDRARFQYPQRPVFFVSLCAVASSAVYLLRAMVGPGAVSCRASPAGGDFLVRGDLEGAWCTTVFTLLYYSTQASAAWWGVLALAWFLASTRKWGREAIESYASYFHMTAWSLPALQTIVVLATRRVDADELTGMCHVGSQDPTALFTFVIVPLGCYLVVGAIFIAAGFLALCRIRRRLALRDGGYGTGEAVGTADVRKLEKLMAKVGLFSAVYLGAQACVLGCLMYEQLHRDDWVRESMARPCRRGTGDRGEGPDCRLEESIPRVEVFALRTASSLVVGVACAIWVCSSKTAASWRAFLCRGWGKGSAAAAAEGPRREAFSHVMGGGVNGGHRTFRKVESKSSIYATLNRGSASLTTIF